MRDINPPTVERDSRGRVKPGSRLNPDGIGGFGERPEDRANGRWDMHYSRRYLLNKFQRMTPSELKAYIIDRGENLTIVEQSCAQTVLETLKKNVNALKWIQEVTDRTEGKPRMQVDSTVDVQGTPTLNIKFA